MAWLTPPLQGLKLHAALPVLTMLDTLVAHGRVTCVAGAGQGLAAADWRCRAEVAASVRTFIAENQTGLPAAAAALGAPPPPPPKPKRLSYGARSALCGNATGAVLRAVLPVGGALSCRRAVQGWRCWRQWSARRATSAWLRTCPPAPQCWRWQRPSVRP